MLQLLAFKITFPGVALGSRRHYVPNFAEKAATSGTLRATSRGAGEALNETSVAKPNVAEASSAKFWNLDPGFGDAQAL